MLLPLKPPVSEWGWNKCNAGEVGCSTTSDCRLPLVRGQLSPVEHGVQISSNSAGHDSAEER